MQSKKKEEEKSAGIHFKGQKERMSGRKPMKIHEVGKVEGTGKKVIEEAKTAEIPEVPDTLNTPEVPKERSAAKIKPKKKNK